MAVEDQRGPSVVPDPSFGATRPRRGRRGRRAVVVLAVVFATILIAAIVASFVSVPYYAITPGSTLDVGSLISVGKAAGPLGAARHRGAVLLTDVEILQLRAIDYPYYAWFDHNATIVGTSQLTGPATAAQYDEQGVIDMATARQAATVVAFRSLGYAVHTRADGVIVYQPEPGSPAAAAFAVDDVITAVGSHPVTNFASLGVGIAGHKPGSVVDVTVRHFASTRRSVLRVRLGSERTLVVDGQNDEVCRPLHSRPLLPAIEPHGAPLPCLGLVYAPGAGGSEESYAVSGLPYSVDLQAEGIVGPSAGLAFTLGLLAKLDRGNLTAGLKIAATGTMAIDGTVGDVGGVPQKTVAVRNAGANVFLVPTVELKVARAYAGPHLKVFAVASVSDALKVLERLGGVLASTHAK